MNKEDILDEYDSCLDLYQEMSQSMTALTTTLLGGSSISPHSVTSRVKERKSLARKVEAKDKYDSLSQVTDIVGLRIISNYSDEVDAIARIIESESQVDAENSIDKRMGMDPDRFGYISLHY